MPLPVRHALRKLGRDIRDARRRRRIPAAIAAQRASISRTTLVKIEKGDPGVAIVFLIAQASREMQGVTMVWIGGQDLLVAFRGGVELARLVMLYRDLQDLFDIVRHGFILRWYSICLNWLLFRH